MICRQRIYVTNYVNQQKLKPDDHYVLPHQRLRTFRLLVCPLSATAHFLICGIVFHHTSLLPPLSIFCCRLKSHLFSLSYPLSDSSLICTVTRHFGHYNHLYNQPLTFNTQTAYLAIFWWGNFLVISPGVVQVRALLKWQYRPSSNRTTDRWIVPT